MLIPAQILPRADDPKISTEVPAEDRTEKPAEPERKPEAPDGFAAIFAALACPIRPSASSGTGPIESESAEASACATPVATEAHEAAPPDPVAMPELDRSLAQTQLPAAGAEEAAPQPAGGADALAGAEAVPPRSAGPLNGSETMQVFVRSIAADSAPAARSVDSTPPEGAAASESIVAHGEATAGVAAAGDLTRDAADDQEGGGPPTKEGAAAAPLLTRSEANAAPATLLQPLPGPAEGQPFASASAAPDRASPPAHHTAELVRHALPQIAEAARQTGRGTVEIALNPAELGHVRLTIHSDDGSMATVRLSADRHDTLDLMRRHVELLAQDMRDLGYRELSFSFQDRPQRERLDFIPPGEQATTPAEQLRIPKASPDALARPSRHADGSLDLRL